MADSDQQSLPAGQSLQTPLNTDNEHTSIDVFAEGDVILVFNDEKNTTRLRVSSLILSNASSVFKAMLGPHFAEGQQPRSAQNPKEISLEEDDTVAMIWLCKLLHHQQEEQSNNHLNAAEGLYWLAMSADKYDCLRAIRLAGAALLEQFTRSSVLVRLYLDSALYLVAAAERFENRRYFALFTRRLVMDYSNSYSELIKCVALQALPSSFLLRIEEQRRNAWYSLHTGILACSTTIYGPARSAPAFPSDLCHKLNGRPGLWPEPIGQHSLTLRAIIHITRSFTDTQLPNTDYRLKPGALQQLAKESNHIARGLCLECLRMDVVSTCTHPKIWQWLKDDI